MKSLLIAIACFCTCKCFAQDTIIKLTKPYIFYPKNGPDQKERNKAMLDSLTTNWQGSQYKGNMPNAIRTPLPEPKLVGNNGKGQNIYELPLDKMPLLKPDSTFRSNMPLRRNH